MLYLLTKFTRTPPYIITYIMFQKNPELVAKTWLEHVAKKQLMKNVWRPKLLIFWISNFILEMPKLFGLKPKTTFPSWISPYEPCPKKFGILKIRILFPKKQLGIQKFWTWLISDKTFAKISLAYIFVSLKLQNIYGSWKKWN